MTLLAAVPASANDSCRIRVNLQNPGAISNATGTVTATLGLKASSFSLVAARLKPGTNYSLYIDDRFTGDFTANRHGGLVTTFVTPPRRGQAVLNFDPRGHLVSLRAGDDRVLQAVVSGAGEPSNSAIAERVLLDRIGSNGTATVLYQLLSNGRRQFAVQVSHVTGTNWSLYVNGIYRSPIDARRGYGVVIFDSATNFSSRPRLDFDPRGQVVDIVRDDSLWFSGKLAARANGVNVATPSARTAFIPSTGVDADGTARARLRVDSDARRKFSVELEHVPVGTYDFLAASSNNVVQAVINVVNTPDGPEGEVEFSSRTDDSDELPLTFDPTNSTFTVQLGGVVYFQGALNVGSATGSNEPPAQAIEALTRGPLAGSGSGDAKYEIDDRGRRKFSVEIEDVPAGTYQLWVAGVMRGNLSATLKNGQVKGELEFRNPSESGKLPLTFDPRGQLIEVKTVAGTFFSHLFGGGSGSGGNGGNTVATVPILIQLPLFSSGAAANASAKVDFKRDDRGRRSFEVEIEDAPLGSYSLLVGGIARGVINVITDPNGTRGQIEFENESKPGKLLLDFDPLGQFVEISRDGVTYFGRTLPAAN